MTIFESNLDMQQGELPLKGMSMSRDRMDSTALDKLPRTIDLSFLKIEDMEEVRCRPHRVGLRDGGEGLRVQITANLMEKGGYDEEIDPETGEREYHEPWVLKDYGAPPELDNLYSINCISYFESYPPEEYIPKLSISCEVVWDPPEYEGGNPRTRFTHISDDEFNIVLPAWLKFKINMLVRQEIRIFKDNVGNR